MGENDGNGFYESTPGATPIQSVPIGHVPIRPGVYKEFNTATVVPIPCRKARYIVRIDGVAYAGFEEKSYALDAMHAWRIRWPAVQNSSLDIAVNF